MKLTRPQREMLTRAAQSTSGGIQAYGASQWKCVERLKNLGLVDSNNRISDAGRAAVTPKTVEPTQPQQEEVSTQP